LVVEAQVLTVKVAAVVQALIVKVALLAIETTMAPAAIGKEDRLSLVA